jgi:hypothetical protein
MGNCTAGTPRPQTLAAVRGEEVRLWREEKRKREEKLGQLLEKQVTLDLYQQSHVSERHETILPSRTG